MRQAPTEHQVRFSIDRLSAWAPGVTSPNEWREWARGERMFDPAGGEPALQQIPAMLRRHAGRLGRLACSPAYESLGDLRDVPMVYSGRFGEAARSVELLTALSAGAELSPTTFGLSVHNAVPGLFTMARRENANSISLAAGDDTAEFGVIEACGLLREGAAQVLLVVADCPLPDIYAKFADTSPVAFGWACLILPPVSDVLSLSWFDADPIYSENSAIGPLAALRVLLGETRELTRQSRLVGQNGHSDPSTQIVPPADPVGENGHSDPSIEIAPPADPVGQNGHSDPSTEIAPLVGQIGQIGQNAHSDPSENASDGYAFGPDFTGPALAARKCRVWRWSRDD